MCSLENLATQRWGFCSKYRQPVTYCRRLNRGNPSMNLNMNEQFADIRPVTRALKQISKARLANGWRHYEGTHHSASLLLEPNCTEWPSALLEENLLQPIYKIVLLIVMNIVRKSSGDAFLPTQDQLARMANVASPDSIWQALLILRCSRWLTACQKMWCKGGAI